jgi:hypothetical protein
LETLVTSYSVFPNPFSKGDLNVSFDGIENSKGRIQIKDITGRTVISNQVEIVSGKNDFIVRENILPGIYIVELEINGNRHAATQLIKL